MVSAENINALLDQAGFVGSIDLLSIDIDFNDYWVWKAIEAAKPRGVVIEYNASLRPPLSLVTPYSPARGWNGGNYFGASLGALVRLAGTKGYRIVGCGFAGVNAFLYAKICAVSGSWSRRRRKNIMNRRAIFPTSCSLGIRDDRALIWKFDRKPLTFKRGSG